MSSTGNADSHATVPAALAEISESVVITNEAEMKVSAAPPPIAESHKEEDNREYYNIRDGGMPPQPNCGLCYVPIPDADCCNCSECCAGDCCAVDTGCDCCAVDTGCDFCGELLCGNFGDCCGELLFGNVIASCCECFCKG